MVKKILILGLILALCTGCVNEQADTPLVVQSEYNNLNDEKNKEALEALFKKHGISEMQTKTLLSWADDFNGRVQNDGLKKGNQPLKEDKNRYSNLQIKLKEDPSGEVSPEANCRLTSFLIAKSFISTNGKITKGDNIIMQDVDVIDNSEMFKLPVEDKEKFTSLFNWVDVKGKKTIEEHEKAIVDFWKDREIKINSSTGLSLITVYLDLPFDEVRFVGHTGILFDEENELIFVEKFAPSAPFQMTSFKDRESLKRYLLNRSDLYGDGSELAPIVMENDKVL